MHLNAGGGHTKTAPKYNFGKFHYWYYTTRVIIHAAGESLYQVTIFNIAMCICVAKFVEFAKPVDQVF